MWVTLSVLYLELHTAFIIITADLSCVLVISQDDSFLILASQIRNEMDITLPSRPAAGVHSFS